MASARTHTDLTSVVLMGQARVGTVTSTNKEDMAARMAKDRSKVLTIRAHHVGCLECRRSHSIQPTDASRTSIRCHTKTDPMRLSHQLPQAATPIMRAIRPILRVATIAPLTGGRLRNARNNPATTTALASTRVNRCKHKASQSACPTAVPVVATPCQLYQALSSKHHQRFHVRMYQPC